MYERFTDRARGVMRVARRTGKPTTVTAVLLALLDEGRGVAVRTLVNLKVDLSTLRQKIEGAEQAAISAVEDKHSGQTEVNTAIEHAFEEARGLNRYGRFLRDWVAKVRGSGPR